MQKEKTLMFKDFQKIEEPQTARVSELDIMRLQFERLKEDHERVLDERDQLIASLRLLSHDLRAPVRAISQLSEWIFDDCTGRLPGEAEQNLLMLRSRAQRLDTMHKELSSYVRCGELFKEEPIAFSLPTLVAKVWQELTAERQDDRHFEFAVDIDSSAEWLTGQPRVMEVVLLKLIENAMHHHDREEGFISVTGRLAEGVFTLSVDDDGPGIPLHLHEQAQAPMKTLRARDKGAGTGLGLSMVRSLVLAAAGSLALEYTFTSTSRGLRVVCSFPMNNA